MCDGGKDGLAKSNMPSHFFSKLGAIIKKSQYEQEIPQSNTAEQPMAP